MVGLVACPFCRELFAAGETDGSCPHCGLRLVPLASLPPSAEGLAEAEARGERLAAEDQPLPWWSLTRGRGLLLVLALGGLVAFTLPWVEITSPHRESLSGLLLARRGSPWLWAGATGWFVSIPLLLSRRTVRQMCGVSGVLALFAVLTAAEVAVLVALPPRGHPLVRYEYAWGLGLYLSGLLGLLGAGVGLRFGAGPPRGPVFPPPPASSERAPDDAPLH